MARPVVGPGDALFEVWPERVMLPPLQMTFAAILAVCIWFLSSDATAVLGADLPRPFLWTLALYSALHILGHLSNLVRRTPVLWATAKGKLVNPALWPRTGPIPWGHVRAVVLDHGGDESDPSFEILLVDLSATYKLLGKHYLGLIRWLTTLGRPIRIYERDIDMPLELLARRLEQLIREHRVS